MVKSGGDALKRNLWRAAVVLVTAPVKLTTDITASIAGMPMCCTRNPATTGAVADASPAVFRNFLLVWFIGSLVHWFISSLVH